MGKKLDQYQQFELYSRALISSKDVDPVYPFIRKIMEAMQVEYEWFIFCYVAFYNLESAIKMCDIFPTKDSFDPDHFDSLRANGYLSKFGIERRGSQRIIGNQITMFFAVQKLLKQIDSSHNKNTRPFRGNEDFRKMITQLPNHGNWAAFKLAELFEKSIPDIYPYFKVADLGIDGKDPNTNDGPVGGLRWLFGRDNKYSKDIIPKWNKFGYLLAQEWGVDIGEVETCMCKWHKMNTGKYFVGHDIMEFIELRQPIEKQIASGAYEEFMAIFDNRFWKGKKHLDKSLKTLFRDKGEIVNADLADKLPRIDVLEIAYNSL